MAWSMNREAFVTGSHFRGLLVDLPVIEKPTRSCSWTSRRGQFLASRSRRSADSPERARADCADDAARGPGPAAAHV